jgi:hypothetical protein
MSMGRLDDMAERVAGQARQAARTKNLKVEPTTPGSKNHWKVTYYDGTEKWVDARPGRGEPSRREQRLLQRKMRSPSVQRAINRLDDALGEYKGDQDPKPLEQAVEKNEVGLDRELAKKVNRLFVKTVKKDEGKDIGDETKEGLQVVTDHVNRFRRDSMDRFSRIAMRVAMGDDLALRKTREALYYVDRAVHAVEVADSRMSGLGVGRDDPSRQTLAHAMNTLYEVETELGRV